MASLIGQLPVWIGATLATWAVCWFMVSPEACQDSPACLKHLKTYPGPPPAIPYIFKFENGSLHLCGPADGRMHRATNFEGPGLCIMEKIEKVSVRNPSKASQLSMYLV
eukprot:Skav201852  [mRNA]  locus=scaffold484:333074:337097:- [translate_table: standard]